MKLKYTLLGIILIVIGGFALWEFGGTSVSQPSERTEQTRTNLNTSGTTVSGEKKDPWGASPFGTGTPVTEAPKPKFQKPNTEWKTRTIQLKDGRWATYVFGEGNPKGSDPLSEKEQEAYKQCYYNTVVNALDCPPIAAYEGGYVTSDIETSLLSLITDPNWEKVLINCEQQFRQYEDPSDRISPTSSGFVSYDTMLNGSGLSLDNLLFIDDRTGRKRLILNNLMNWFHPILRGTEQRIGDNPVDISKINNCVTQNGGIELYRAMDNLNQKSYYPDGHYPVRVTDPKHYIPLY